MTRYITITTLSIPAKRNHVNIEEVYTKKYACMDACMHAWMDGWMDACMQCQFMAALNNLHVQILATKLQNPSAMIQ